MFSEKKEIAERAIRSRERALMPNPTSATSGAETRSPDAAAAAAAPTSAATKNEIAGRSTAYKQRRLGLIDDHTNREPKHPPSNKQSRKHDQEEILIIDRPSTPVLPSEEGEEISIHSSKTENHEALDSTRPGAVAVPGLNLPTSEHDDDSGDAEHNRRVSKNPGSQFLATAYCVSDSSREIPLAIAATPPSDDEGILMETRRSEDARRRTKQIRCVLAVIALLVVTGVAGTAVGIIYGNRRPAVLLTNAPTVLQTGEPSATPSAAPSSVPTAVATSGSEITVLIKITFDAIPRDFGMTLFNERGNIMANVPAGSFVNVTSKTLRYRLDPGEYDLRVTDSGKDGLCCVYGSGSIEIFTEIGGGPPDLLVSNNGTYGRQADIPFVLAVSNVPQPSPTVITPYPTRLAIGNGPFEIQLEIDLDAFPQEVGLILQNTDADDFVIDVLFNAPSSFFSSKGNYSQAFNVESGLYILLVTDTFADGICCYAGDGEIRIVNNADGRVLASSNGDYGEGTTLRFAVGDATLSPTIAPTSARPSMSPAPSFTPPVTPYPTAATIGDGEVLVVISVIFDEFPAEFSMTLSESETPSVVASYPFGTFDSPGALFEQNFYLNPGKFLLSVGDSGNDGICCGFGRGSIFVLERYETPTSILVSELALSDGNYGNGTVLEFEVVL